MWNIYGLQLAPRRIGIAAGVDEDGLQAVGDLADGKAGGGGDFADDHRDLVAFDQSLGFRGGGLRVDRILHHQLYLTAHHTPGIVDLLGSELHAHDRIFAERPEKAGERSEMADADRISLPAHDRGGANTGQQCGAGGAFDQRAA